MTRHMRLLFTFLIPTCALILGAAAPLGWADYNDGDDGDDGDDGVGAAAPLGWADHNATMMTMITMTTKKSPLQKPRFSSSSTTRMAI